MICITGVPGSGKTTVSRKLKDMGFNCIRAEEIKGYSECIEADQVDVDCLKGKLSSMETKDLIVESHYSHLLGCDLILILERSIEEVRKTLVDRGYTVEKINDNLDALMSDSIYYESLESLPAPLIKKITVKEYDTNGTASACAKIVNDFLKIN